MLDRSSKVERFTPRPQENCANAFLGDRLDENLEYCRLTFWTPLRIRPVGSTCHERNLKGVEELSLLYGSGKRASC
jgi:hypothetical protein